MRGANYFTVNSSQEFKKLLDREFNYMVTPLVYDLKLELESRDYEIDAIYGSPEVDLASGDIHEGKYTIPIPTDERGAKGGVVLLKVQEGELMGMGWTLGAGNRGPTGGVWIGG